MISHNLFKVKTKNYKSCFVYLKPCKGFESGCPVQVVGENDTYYFSMVFTEGLDSDSIGISSVYAKILGFKDEESVVVSRVQTLPVVNKITIRPSTQADYEVLELLAQSVQSNLLDQVRVVRAGQKICIWLGNSLFVTVMVETVHPVILGTLDFLTQVVINPPTENPLSQSISEDVFDPHSAKVNSLVELIKFWKKPANPTVPTKQLDEFDSHLKFSLRLAPLSEFLEIPSNPHQFTVYTVQSCLTDLRFVEHEPFYQMSLLNQVSDKVLYVKLKLLENGRNTSEVFVHDCIFNFLKTHVGDRVVLKKVTTNPLVEHILIEGKGQDLVIKVKECLADNCTEPYVLNGKFPLTLGDNSLCSLDFGGSKFCIVDESFLRKCSYSCNNAVITPIDEYLKKHDDSNIFCIEVKSTKKACSDILTALVKGGVFRGDNVVVTGNLGTGKTSVLRHVTNTLRSYPHFLYTETVNCKSLKGKTVESLQKLFSDIFAELILSQPSLLVLDDLHVICEANENEDNPNSIHHNRVSEMLYRLFKVVQNVHCIGILASTIAISKLNARIYRSRERYLFGNVFTIQDLSKEDRLLLLRHYFKSHEPDYDALALETDGFVVQDIENLYFKALFEAYKDSSDQSGDPVINSVHCSEALKKSCALSIQNVQFHSLRDKSFIDIGGLYSVKFSLMESLLWPLKYSNIFANSPLRLQSGILLYGPPGAGKTLLACAAAKQCSLRLISVKGPELLSKYIGASEQSVREIFEKAQRAKPCILFFDEFDSLAPRRGHDNTGVTDRVVNQLLTQLDGVESLKGVFVLAATSRPDLLDPALLRPGRLDKQLLCPMPNKDDRLEILKILSRKLNLDDNVDFEVIAIKTEGYSGADLHSILCTAQLSTMKNILHGDHMDQPKIDQICLIEALGQTRPSLTKRERDNYEIIYQKFCGGRLDDFKAGSKVTLA